MKKIVLAFDSFKGSATSAEVAAAAARGIREVFPAAEIAVVPVADGGEGTVAAISAATATRTVECTVSGPAGEAVNASYAITADGTTAVMEMAAAAGLTLLPEHMRNPLDTNTAGVGQMVRHAIGAGCRSIIMGLGGSATNDAATGMLAALGVRFLDAGGNTLAPCGRNLERIARIDTSGLLPALAGVRFTLACDVRNPFCGPDGAACVFAPQKGATPRAVRQLDEGMRAYAGVILRSTGMDITDIPGAGAAGGMAGGLLPFLNAEIKSGIDTVLDAIGFSDTLAGADLVLTGEGRIDSQSAMGKAVGGILCRASARHIPVVALAGDVRAASLPGLTAAFSIQQGPTTLAEAMNPTTTLRNITLTTRQILQLMKVKTETSAHGSKP